ncbi:ATP-binding protein [Paraburkholderia sp. J67]|uniref:ATP-binding protein n=1 Tax=Paraburkholderia sp. J67 TaxID=2805435 RepID=UPI002ABD13E3|nr:ATP-binding protein [Paraburkholderia sp. J67]
MILDYQCSLGHYKLVASRPRRPKGENTFTVIVGKNGTGKSRLLRSIVQYLLRQSDRDTFVVGDRDRFDLTSSINTLIDFEKVICVSSSPFDRFPLPRRSSVTEEYNYLGIRGLSSTNLSYAYLSKTVATLVESAVKHRERTHAIADVLGYLGYKPKITIVLQTLPLSLLKDLASHSNPHEVLHARLTGTPTIFGSESANAIRRMLGFQSSFIRKIAEKLVKLPRNAQLRTAHITIEPGDLLIQSAVELNEGPEILTYLDSGFLRLKDVTFQKHGSSENIKINDASSGEQSVVLSLLGIASQIRDKSAVCIDEPELCLHPEWQEKYIHLLHSTFRHVKDCHFLIATHSPQIVAQLPSDNCHVMSMETRVATTAARYSRRSIDYQLAEVFGAPGYRNEYLSRTALSLFSSVSKNRAFDSESLVTLKSLEEKIDLLNLDDPVRDLILALQDLRIRYE